METAQQSYKIKNALYTEEACAYIKNHTPRLSAHNVITNSQKIVLIILIAIIATIYIIAKKTYLIITLALFAITTIAPNAITLWGVIREYKKTTQKNQKQNKNINLDSNQKIINSIEDKTLPIYTVAVALYDEAGVLPQLITALERIIYPKDKIQILIILEENDLKTQNAIKYINIEPQFEIIIVPQSKPQTKPKALNYIRRIIKGTYITVYDAEDIPEPTQLIQAIHHFRNADPDVVCLQAPLTITNGHRNWITANFQVEYACHFLCFLSNLTKTKIPIPLGGTSNHFKTDILKKIGAWDPYNVTEDADLGIRLARDGYKVEMLDSMTFETAPYKLKNWTKQRTRWTKGWIQTWLVHMRNPKLFYQQVGKKSFILFQIYMVCPIIARILACVLFINGIEYMITEMIQYQYQNPPVENKNQIAMSIKIQIIVCAIIFITAYIAAAIIYLYTPTFMSKRPKLKYLFTLPLYWICITICVISAITELIKDPFRWNKTAHDEK